MNAKADSEKWLILGFTIGFQMPAVVEYFSIPGRLWITDTVLRVRLKCTSGTILLAL